VLERLFLPRGHVRHEIPDRQGVSHARLQQLRIGQPGVRVLEFLPRSVDAAQWLVSIHYEVL
jgi:hypothetical protein